MDALDLNLAQQQVIIEEEEYPEQFRKEHYDAVLIYAAADQELAKGFYYILQNYTQSNGRPPKVYLLDHDHRMGTSLFVSIGEAIRRSTLYFLLVTEEFCKDPLSVISRDDSLIETLENREKLWHVIPVLNDAKENLQNLPFGLRALQSIRTSRIFVANSTLTLEQCAVANPPTQASQISADYMMRVTKLFNEKLHLRLEREANQARQLQIWLEEELEKRRQIRLEEEHSRLLRRVRRERERQALIDKLQARIDDPDHIPLDRLVNTPQPLSLSSGSAEGYHEEASSRKSQEVVVHNHYHAKRIININGPTQIGDNNQIGTLSSGSESVESSDCEYVVRVETAEDMKITTNGMSSESTATVNCDLLQPLSTADVAALVLTPSCSSPQGCDEVEALFSPMHSVGNSISPGQSSIPDPCSRSPHSFPSHPTESGKSSGRPVVAVIEPTFIALKESIAHNDVQGSGRNETAPKHREQNEADEETGEA